MAEYMEQWSSQPPDMSDLAAAQDLLLIQNAVDKTYKQKLRKFKSMMTPEWVQEMRATLPPRELQQFAALLADVEQLPDEDTSSPSAEDDDELTPQEAAALHQLGEAMQLPDDFGRWVRCGLVSLYAAT